MVQPAAAMLGAMLFLPFNHAQASTTSAEKAYQKGDFTAAQREYAKAAQRDPKNPDLEFNAGAAAYKAGQFPQAVEAFQKSLAGKPSADPKRLAAQEDAYYDLGNTLYRNGEKTETSNPQQTIQTWERAVKTYDAALQLQAHDADAKYNRDFVERKLEQLKKQQTQPQQNQQSEKQDQKQDQNDQNQQNQSGRKSDQKNEQNKDHKSDQQSQSGQNGQAKNQENKDQKPGADSKPDEKKDQQQANGGSKPGQQKQQDQQAQQPKPSTGQPQGSAQAQAGADQRKEPSAQTSESQREPGQMSKEEARALLDSLKGEERRLPAAPVARTGNDDQRTDQPIKDW